MKKSKIVTLVTGAIVSMVMMVASVGLLWQPRTKDIVQVGATSVVTDHTHHYTFAGECGDGDGSVGNPFLIGSFERFNILVRQQAPNANRHFVMINDIDFEGRNWTAIPTLHADSIFDGNNYTISNLHLTGVGLFSIVFGVVRNLQIDGITSTPIASGNRAAITGVAGVHSYFHNISILSGNIEGAPHHIGGIIGDTHSIAGGHIQISNVFNAANFNADGINMIDIGGIVGRIHTASDITFTNVQNVGTINAGQHGAGIAARTVRPATATVTPTIKLTNAINSGNIEASVASTVGGILGVVTNFIVDIDSAVNYGEITGGANTAGGIVGGILGGDSITTINNVVNNGNISGVEITGAGIIARFGSAPGAELNIENAVNNGDVYGSRQLGGIIGLGGWGAVINISHVTNYGAINPTLANATSGGIAGNIDQPLATPASFLLEWAINNAPVNGSLVSGILGRAGGTAPGGFTIRNTIQNGDIGPSATTIVRMSTTQCPVFIENTFYNSTLTNVPMSNIITGAFTIDGISGGRTSQEIHTQSFLNFINANGGESAFLLHNGKVILRAHTEVFTYSFYGVTGDPASIVLAQPVDELTITLPDRAHPNAPTRIGHMLTGWLNQDTATRYDLGDTFTNAAETDTSFVAEFTPIMYEIVVTGPTGQTQAVYINTVPQTGADRVIGLGTGVLVELSNSTWAADFQWLARLAGTDGYVHIAPTQTFNLSLLFNEAFVTNHAIGNRIYITAVSAATTSIINVGPTIAAGAAVPGTLAIQISGETSPRQVALGSSLSLPNEALITRFIATPNAHFEFDSLYINGTPITEINVDLSTPILLSSINGETISVNFAPIEYQVEIVAALQGTTTAIVGSESFITLGAVSDAAVGGNVNATATAIDAPVGFRFARWRIVTPDGVQNIAGHAQGNLNLNFSAIGVDGAFLTEMLFSGRILIIAEYVQTFAVSVNMGDFAIGNDVGFLIIEVIDSLGESFLTGSLNEVELPLGSTIVVQAVANEFFQIGTVTAAHGQTVTINEFGGFEFEVTMNHNIVVNFANEAFEIIFQARDGVNNVGGVSGFVTTVNNATDNVVRLDDEIRNIQTTTDSYRDDHRFVNFTILDGQGGTIIIDSDVEITMDLLVANLNTRGQFVITANYIRVYTLNVVLAGDSLGMGTFTVRVYGQTEATTQRTFDRGTRLIITATPLTIGGTVITAPEFRTGLASGEITGGVGEIMSLNIGRTVTIGFTALPFNLNDSLSTSGGGDLVASDNITGARIGYTVVLMANPPGNREIRDWTVNGRSIDTLERDARFTVFQSGDSVSITLTREWLNEFGLRLDSEVTFGIPTGVLIAILIPSILIPILLAAAVLYYLRSKKKYAEVRAALVDANRQKVMFNTGSFISDLKEGKDVGNVSKEDIKKKMKEDKKKDQ